MSVSLFLGVLILSISEVFIWSKFYDCKFNFSKISHYASIILLSFIGMFGSLYFNAFIKMIIILLFLCLTNWFIFRRKINEIIISTFISELLLTISDSLFVLLWILIFSKDTEFMKNNVFHTFISNFIVALINVGLCSIPIVKKIYLKIVSISEKIDFKKLIYICVFLIFSINFLVAIMYYDMKSIYIIIINLLFIIFYSFIVYKAMNEKSISELVKAENKSLMENLNEYENMVDRQRVDNHENKNQLLIIKNMVKKKDEDVVRYIDTIVKDEKEDDEALYARVKSIPSGGLQGIIYQKMLVMKDEKIQFSLDVSRDVRKIDLSNFSMENNYKLCKIIGVILDNSIEECRNLDEKLIMISLYIDDDLFIVDISNRFKSNVDVDRIDDEGYTTKGNGHGYGLSLVKKIVDESNGVFVNERRITTDVFKQVIKVKI